MSTKPLLVEIAAHRARDGMAQAQALRITSAAQIEIAILEPQLFRHRLVVSWNGGVFDLFSTSSSRASSSTSPVAQVRIDRARGPRAHAALDREHELAAQPLGLGEHRRAVRIEHDLQQAFAVAQVDENHAAVIAAAVHPAGHANLAPDQRAIHLSAVMSAHRQSLYAEF